MPTRHYTRGQINRPANEVILVDNTGKMLRMLIATSIQFDCDTLRADSTETEQRLYVGSVALEDGTGIRTLFGYAVHDADGKIIPDEMIRITLM